MDVTAFSVVRVSSSMSKTNELAMLFFDTETGGRVAVTIEPMFLNTVIKDMKKSLSRLEEFTEWYEG